MTVTVYVDGGGGTDPKYGFFIKESEESHVAKCPPEIINDKTMDKIPEYMALKSALEWLQDKGMHGEEITIYSDFQSMVGHVNHDFAINNNAIRDIVREIWSMINKFDSLKVEWIRREENLAGKMLGS